MSINTVSHDELHRRYSECLEWMENVGVQLGVNRLAQYDKVVGRWREIRKTASEDEGKEIFPDFVSSVFEIQDFIDIYLAFRYEERKRLAALVFKLNKSAKGPVNAADERSNSTEARNFLFEAVTAARLHRPQAGLATILDAESDTGVRVGAKKLWIECKRVTSIDRLEDNFRKATRQLEALLKHKVGSGHRGIVSVDASKILTKGDEILPVRSEPDLLATADAIINLFHRQCEPIWEMVYARRDKKIIGTIFRFAFMAAVEDRESLVRTSQWVVLSRRGVTPADQLVQEELSAKLRT